MLLRLVFFQTARVQGPTRTFEKLDIMFERKVPPTQVQRNTICWQSIKSISEHFEVKAMSWGK